MVGYRKICCTFFLEYVYYGYVYFFFFSSRRRHTRCREVSWARRCVQETGIDIKEERVIDCNESGSTLRFLVPIAAIFNGVNRFIGRGNLGKRPLDTYYNIFDQQGIKYTYKEGILDLSLLHI
eukprot:TRINITY_DN36778_c0_g1_i1.p2 TRINITY_DN36778_c0_g1~~TRINITY_DN36778_c0_g1_i1.p2  ORF type:complete len:123 (-),score=35.87 TRINITY_DN36778_c0_g1_i1:131-499(-)